MCGLVLVVGEGGGAAIGAMAAALAHRGPDEQRTLSWEGVHVGFRRLRVVDLEQGSQPLSSADGRCTLVMNGEIYNHRELRQELEGLGHVFQTHHADSEALLVGYQAWGEGVLDRLEGMFAFVLVDRERRVLFGARDRFGEKPLYLTRRAVGGCRFAAASEPAALLAHPGLRAALDLSARALLGYLTHDYVPGRGSMWEGVDRLLPGECFTFHLDDEALERRRWYRPRPPARFGRHDVEAAAWEVRASLIRAVERRLAADVPVGVFLSGGIDSSLVAAIACRAGVGAVQTFSIGFDDERFDESAAARRVADQLGTAHHHRVFRVDDLLHRVDAVFGHLGEPFADPSVLPYDRLSAFAREHVTVALGGDGGDELFYGYDPFRAVGAARLVGRLPASARDGLRRGVERWARGTDGSVDLSFAARRFLQGASAPAAERGAWWMAPFSPERLARVAPHLLGVAGPPDPLAGVEPRAGLDDAGQLAEFFQGLYLPDDILVKADRASMLHGLEVRAPFLDSDLVALANGLPTGLKLRAGRTKRVLKAAALLADERGPLLDEGTVHRKKKGFGIPVARWLKGPLLDRCRDELLGPWPAALDVFDRSEVAVLIDRHVAGTENLYKELWALLALRVWARHHLEGREG